MKTYRSHLRLLTTWLTHQNLEDIERIKTEDLQNYLEHVKQTRHDRRTGSKSPTTVRQQALTIKTFFRWVTETNLIQSDPSKDLLTPKRPRHLPRALTVDQVKMLIQAARNIRDRAIICLIADSGMRRTEIAQLELEDIDLKRGIAHVRHGKGDKERYVIFAEKTCEALQDWLRARNAKPEVKAVFTTKEGMGMQPNGIYKTIRRAALKAGVNAKPHWLRHSFATRYLDRGGNIHDLQSLLGHEDIRTTMIYVSVSLERLCERHKQLSFVDEILKDDYNAGQKPDG